MNFFSPILSLKMSETYSEILFCEFIRRVYGEVLFHFDMVIFLMACASFS